MEHFQSAYQEEKDRLDRTLRDIDSQLKALRSIPVYTGHDFTEQVLEAGRQSHRQQLERSIREPYFGRLDFEEQGKEAQPLYIGKVGVGDQDGGKPVVIDWRAPVASLFYSFTGGDSASYDAPEGLIEGLVYLKRNIVIRKGILERVVDTYNKDSEGPAVSDEFLVYRLGENKDNRLRDIVSTIQAEQDLIIRAARNTALIIQGVAGSGKTTVALHRLAFCCTSTRNKLKRSGWLSLLPTICLSIIFRKFFRNSVSAIFSKALSATGRPEYWDWIRLRRMARKRWPAGLMPVICAKAHGTTVTCQADIREPSLLSRFWKVI